MKKILILFAVLLFAMPVQADEGINIYYDLAETFVGEPGDCYQTAQRYLQILYKDDNFKIRRSEYVEVDYEDAIPGDIIFYENGGLNTTHWAVYLGNGEALQGNWLGYARIDSVYLKKATDPIFYHLTSKNKIVMHFDTITLE